MISSVVELGALHSLTRHLEETARAGFKANLLEATALWNQALQQAQQSRFS